VTDFRDAVDAFMAAPKMVTGVALWAPSRNVPDQAAFWPLLVDGSPSAHQLKIEARLGTPWRGFCILLLFAWMGAHPVVMRLNVDADEHTHTNWPPRPPGVPPEVQGNRIYLWSDNRHKFRPSDIGLPYARQLERRHAALHNALRHFASEARIDLADADLPDYPKREALF